MAKRLTDTLKWEKPWFRKLGPRLRDLRQYVLDRCDHAGIIENDLETFSYYLGSEITTDDINAAFQNKIRFFEDKILVLDFIKFQYKCDIDELNPDNKVHKSVIARLNTFDLKALARPLEGACLGAKDKDKEKEKRKDKEKENPVRVFENQFQLNFNKLFDGYPRQQKKSRSLALMRDKIKTQSRYDEISMAIENYVAYVESQKIDYNFILTFPSFFDEWRDWLTPPKSPEQQKKQDEELELQKHYEEIMRKKSGGK